MHLLVALASWVFALSGLANPVVVRIKPCTTPFWLELRDTAKHSTATMTGCGAGEFEPVVWDEAFALRFSRLELEQIDGGWQLSWSLAADTPADAAEPLHKTRLRADRRPVGLLVSGKASSATVAAGAYQVTLWPRIAPNDVQITANADGAHILRELARVTGMRIDGIELLPAEPFQVQFASIERDQLTGFLASRGWLLRVGPDHVRLGTPRATGTAQLSQQALLDLVQPRAAGDFPQPAIDLHAKLALTARSKGEHAQAFEHIQAAEQLLQPYTAGNVELLQRLRIERAELLASSEDVSAALAVLPQLDPSRDDPDLLLRALALQARHADAARIQPELDQLAARLDALPGALTVTQMPFLHSVRTAAVIAGGDLDAALPMQAQAARLWQALPFAHTQFETGVHLRRQLLRNEIMLAGALLRAQRYRAAADRLQVARWLEEVSDEPSDPQIELLEDQLRKLRDR